MQAITRTHTSSMFSSGAAGYFLYYGTIAYLLSQFIDGPLRFILESSGAVFILYLRDLIPLSVVGIAVGRSIVMRRASRLGLGLAAILVFYSAVGMLLVGDPFRILFGVKILLPLMLGLICDDLFCRNLRGTARLIVYAFALSCAGIALNLIVQFPWQGWTYEVGGVRIEGSWLRGAGGFDKLVGFARTSAEAASHVLLLAIAAITLLRGRLVRAIIWIVAGVAIALTITKTLIVVHIVLTLFLFVRYFARRFMPLYRVAFLGVPLALMVALPLTLSDLDLDYSDPVQFGPFATLADRIENAWPDVMGNVKNQGSPLVGLGIGGSGAGEEVLSAEPKAPADNMFVYLYAWFGAPALVMILALYWFSDRLRTSHEHWDLAVFLWLITVACYGITSVIVESPAFGIALGMCIARLSRRCAHEPRSLPREVIPTR